VLDLVSRKKLGYAMSEHHDAELAVASLRMAAANRGGTVDGVIFHSDRGSEEYTAETFEAACRRLDGLQSMGRVGSALDNAASEAFNSTIKVEYIHRHRFRTRVEARLKITTWIVTSTTPDAGTARATACHLSTTSDTWPRREAPRPHSGVLHASRGLPCTLIRACCGPELGTETSATCSTSGPPNVSNIIAFVSQTLHRWLCMPRDRLWERTRRQRPNMAQRDADTAEHHQPRRLHGSCGRPDGECHQDLAGRS